MYTVDAVECVECKKLMRKDSEDYFKLVGDIFLGSEKVIIGGNTMNSVTVLCKDCLISELKRYRNEEVIRGDKLRQNDLDRIFG